ncbi:hypothetical protein, partial [Streptococcus anginosus]|nr:hypothetical protein [Streptococcus anginosus]
SKSVYPNKSKKKNEVKSIELTPEWLDNREEDKYRNRKKEFTDEERENFLEEMKKKREFED